MMSVTAKRILGKTLVLFVAMFVLCVPLGHAEGKDINFRGKLFIIADYDDFCIYMDTRSFKSNWPLDVEKIPGIYKAEFKQRLITYNGYYQDRVSIMSYEVDFKNKTGRIWGRDNKDITDMGMILQIIEHDDWTNTIDGESSPAYFNALRVLWYDIQRNERKTYK